MTANIRSLLSKSLLYGIADVLVVLVSGLLLLPLYTRTLSQSEFATLVVVRTITELLCCVIFFGVPSAMARLYFDHRKVNRQNDYIGTLAIVFTLAVLPIAALTYLFGDAAWTLFAPEIGADAYLWFCIGTAVFFVYGLLGITWLRLDENIKAVVVLQVFSALCVALFAWLALSELKLGLNGLLSVLLLANLPATLALFFRLTTRFKSPVSLPSITETIQLGLPILITQLSNFTLSRSNLFILQHWVDIETVAIYGLATQLASLINVACVSFSKAIQPSVFRADPKSLGELLARLTPLHIGAMTFISIAFVFFVEDILAIAAPSKYGRSYEILLLLVIANLISSFCLIPDTALLYFKRTRTALTISAASGAASALIGLLFISFWGAYGAAAALIVSFGIKLVMGQLLAARFVTINMAPHALVALFAAFLLFGSAELLHIVSAEAWIVRSAKTSVLLLAAGTTYFYLRRSTGRRARPDSL